MGAYEDNLRHYAVPQEPNERERAMTATIEDHEALWFADCLREFAHYGNHDHDSQSGIAIGYASYIDQQVREHGNSYIDIYAHTEVAVETLIDTLTYVSPDSDEDGDDYPIVLHIALADAFYPLLEQFTGGEGG